jgi:hypothetical protein
MMMVTQGASEGTGAKMVVTYFKVLHGYARYERHEKSDEITCIRMF